VTRAHVYAYRDRKDRKGQFRSLWITRLSAACRASGITYSRFMHGLHRAGVLLDRKALSNMAIEDPSAFQALVQTARTGLGEERS
jgi:large subunit ribosomal protein L20